jgi:hypothetical protein
MFAINIAVQSTVNYFFIIYVQNCYPVNDILFQLPSYSSLWRGFLLGMDLNALVAENRTWLQFLMEQASDLHLSYLLEASVSQV